MTPVEWDPALDLTETAEALVVEVEVPGIDPTDVHLVLRGELLMVTGEKRGHTPYDERHHRMERAYGRFARAVPLPLPVDGSRVSVVFTNGLLTVTLPKASTATAAA
jgi:HSP20 family protein